MKYLSLFILLGSLAASADEPVVINADGSTTPAAWYGGNVGTSGYDAPESYQQVQTIGVPLLEENNE